MKVLLVHPPTSSKRFEPPLGIAYLAAVLRRSGHPCTILDMDPAGVAVSDLPALLAKEEPGLVGVSFMTPQADYAKEILAAARRALPRAYVVAGGVHPTVLPEEVLGYDGVDAVVIGEGEQTLVELVGRIAAGTRSLEGVAGLAWKGSDGSVGRSDARALVPDLDAIPFPAWDELRRYSYTDIPVHLGVEVPVFPIITARGCPFQCSFCDEGAIWGRRVRFRTVPNVLDEIEWLYREFEARHFNVLDDTFTLRPKRVLEFCEGLRSRGLRDVEWRCTGKVNTVNLPMLSAMRQAGCTLVGYGVESSDLQVLKNLRKRQTLDQVRQAFRATHQAGLLSFALCMVGSPGETLASVDHTIEFLKEIGADFATCTILTPYPGSELYDVYRRQGWIRVTDWAKWVPTPHLIPGYRPVAVTDTMGQDDILRAYYRFNRAILGARLRRRYGRCYFVSPTFLRREIVDRIRIGGLKKFVEVVGGLLRG